MQRGVAAHLPAPPARLCLRSESQNLPVVRFASGRVVTLGRERWAITAGTLRKGARRHAVTAPAHRLPDRPAQLAVASVACCTAVDERCALFAACLPVLLFPTDAAPSITAPSPCKARSVKVPAKPRPLPLPTPQAAA